jgi:hypothetical protein
MKMKNRILQWAVLTMACALIAIVPVSGMAQGMGSRTGSSMGGSGTSAAGLLASMAGKAAGDLLNGAAMGVPPASVTVGEDGNIYVMSRLVSSTTIGTTTTTVTKTKLSVFKGDTGAAYWTLTLDEDWATRPVLGPDGRVFLVAMEPRDLGVKLLMGQTPATLTNAKLYIIDPPKAANAVVVPQIITLSGEAASEPTIYGSGTNYKVYLVSYDLSFTLDTAGKVQSVKKTSTFYAFSPLGSKLFSIPLD